MLKIWELLKLYSKLKSISRWEHMINHMRSLISHARDLIERLPRGFEWLDFGRIIFARYVRYPSNSGCQYDHAWQENSWSEWYELDRILLLLAFSDETRVVEYQDVIGLEDIVEQENLKKLIVFFPAANSESTTSAVQIPRLSLVHHPHVTLYNKILDAHLYVFSHWVLQMMSDLPDPKSIKCSLLPKLIELQNNAHNQGIYWSLWLPNEWDLTEFPVELIGGTLPKEALLDPLETASAMSVRRGHKTNRLNCMVYLLDEKTYCGRANTSKSFMEINRDVAKGITSFTPLETANSRGAFISESSTVDKTTTVGIPSLRIRMIRDL